MERAHELMRQHAYAAEILGFYVSVCGLQEQLHESLSAMSSRFGRPERNHSDLSTKELEELSSNFDFFLSAVERCGPAKLADLSREIRAPEHSSWPELLGEAWRAPSPSDAQTILVQAFLQPYAELLHSRTAPKPTPQRFAACPYCGRKPAWGVLRQMGEGGARSMVCAFCLSEWHFRRLVCPGCGEENDARLSVFTATEFDYIRVECCDTCKTYVKTVDLTKNGRAEPMVDELASSPLDAWAVERGYAKLHMNSFGM